MGKTNGNVQNSGSDYILPGGAAQRRIVSIMKVNEDVTPAPVLREPACRIMKNERTKAKLRSWTDTSWPRFFNIRPVYLICTSRIYSLDGVYLKCHTAGSEHRERRWHAASKETLDGSFSLYRLAK